MIALILLLSFGVALAQNKPAPVAPKPVETTLSDADKLAIRELQVRIGREAETIAQREATIKASRERQFKLTEELQRLAAQIGKRLGCAVQEDQQTGELTCLKSPETPSAKETSAHERK